RTPDGPDGPATRAGASFPGRHGQGLRATLRSCSHTQRSRIGPRCASFRRMSPPHMSSFALLAMLLLAYTYAGYPLLVAMWAFLFPCRLTNDDEFEPTISICMAVFNGGPWLEAKLASLQHLEY